MVTSGTLSGLQELLASWIAQDRNKDGHYFTSRVPKMAVYGSLISAPLGHVLISILQRIFAGQTSLKAKLLQILVSNVVVRPFLLHNVSFIPYSLTNNSFITTDFSDSKLNLLSLYGYHRRRPHIPPSTRDGQGGLPAHHEGDMGD